MQYIIPLAGGPYDGARTKLESKWLVKNGYLYKAVKQKGAIIAHKFLYIGTAVVISDNGNV